MATSNDSVSKESKNSTDQSGLFARILLFVRQVVAELKKVIWPTRDELSTYFMVVIAFVLAMVIFTGIVDVVFVWLVNKVFGG